MATVTCLLTPAGSGDIHGRPIVGIAENIAENMAMSWPGMSLAAMAATLADLPWFDAEDEGAPPGTMWWSLVNVVQADGVTQVHFQAEPAHGGVAVYMPAVDGFQAGS